MKKIICSAIFALTTSIASYGAVILVPDDQPTIQAAINAAGSGDIIKINHFYPDENVTITGKTNLTIEPIESVGSRIGWSNSGQSNVTITITSCENILVRNFCFTLWNDDETAIEIKSVGSNKSKYIKIVDCDIYCPLPFSNGYSGIENCGDYTRIRGCNIQKVDYGVISGNTLAGRNLEIDNTRINGYYTGASLNFMGVSKIENSFIYGGSKAVSGYVSEMSLTNDTLERGSSSSSYTIYNGGATIYSTESIFPNNCRRDYGSVIDIN